MQTLNRNITLSKFGVDISKAENFNEALQIPKANYTVVTSPVYYKKAGEVLKTPDAQCTVALWKDEKRSEFIATVGSKYTPLQNPEALRICEVLAGKDGKYHRAYVSPSGGFVNFRMKIAEERIIDDIVMGFVDVSNSHDGTSAARVSVNFEKLVCKNGMTAILEQFKIMGRHTKSIQNLGAKAEQLMRASNVGLKYLKEVAEDTVKIHISEQRWAGIVNNLVPLPDDASTRMKHLVDERRSLLYEAFNAADLANFRNTGWAALNAVTDFVTHLNSEGRFNEERHARRLLHDTNGDQMVKQAVQLVMAAN